MITLCVQNAVCFDVDCTITVNDTLDLLAEFMGVGEAVATLTNKVGMAHPQAHHFAAVNNLAIMCQLLTHGRQGDPPQRLTINACSCTGHGR